MGFFKYTIGLECWVESYQTRVPTMVKIEFGRTETGSVTAVPVSGWTLGQLKSYSCVEITADEWSDRPHDYYDDSVEALWALSLFGIRPVALEEDDYEF